MKKIIFKKRYIALIIVLALGIFDIIFFGMSFSYKIPNQLTEYSAVLKEGKLIKPNFVDLVFQTNEDHCFRITFEDSSRVYKVPSSVLDGFDVEEFCDEISVGQSITVLADKDYTIYKLTANDKDYLSLEDSQNLMEKNRSEFLICAIVMLIVIVIIIICYFGLLIIYKYKSNL